MMRLKVLVPLLCLIINVFADEIIRKTKFGDVRGRIEFSNLDGTPFEAYRGIRYAKPLTKDTMFQDSEPVEPWSDVWDATSHGSICLGFEPLFGSVVGDIDCLFMNVYVPKDIPEDAKLPCMIWIYGGGFIFGSGDDPIYGADFLMPKNIILVTFNYRLGPFGFLDAEDPSCPGNMGLKDQTRLMKFVKEIAVDFNGDPEKITIFGHSAGAASVQYHLMSPMSKGLFRNAIQQSGSSLNYPWAFTSDKNASFRALKKNLDLKSSSPKDIIEELKDWDPADIVEKFFESVGVNGQSALSVLSFCPSVNSKIDGIEQFLTDTPENLMKTGQLNKVPVLIGITADEGTWFAMEMLRIFENLPDNNPIHFETYLSYDMINNSVSPENYAADVFQYYTGEPVLGGNLQQIIELMSDSYFFYGVWLSINFYKQLGISTYVYYLDYPTQGTIVKQFQGIDVKGCIHGEDVLYLFYSFIIDNGPKKNDEIEIMINTFTSTWTNFAKFNDPTPEGSNLVKWESYTDTTKVLKLNTNPEMIDIRDIERNFFKRMCFWHSLANEEHQECMNL